MTRRMRAGLIVLQIAAIALGIWGGVALFDAIAN